MPFSYILLPLSLCLYGCCVCNPECPSILLLFTLYITTPLLTFDSVLFQVSFYEPSGCSSFVIMSNPVWIPMNIPAIRFCRFLMMHPFTSLELCEAKDCILNVLISPTFSTVPNNDSHSVVFKKILKQWPLQTPTILVDSMSSEYWSFRQDYDSKIMKDYRQPFLLSSRNSKESYSLKTSVVWRKVVKSGSLLSPIVPGPMIPVPEQLEFPGQGYTML